MTGFVVSLLKKSTISIYENFTYTLIEKQLNSMKSGQGLLQCTHTCTKKKQLYFIWNWVKKNKKNSYWRKEERIRKKEKKKIEMCISEITWVDRVQQYFLLFSFCCKKLYYKICSYFYKNIIKRHEKVQIVFFPSFFLYIFAWLEGKIKNHENIS